ncbi:MAG: hypothetical protein FVQ82_07785 [Planctomycetes bacterium]|nr:hypothetical protein [Planctomycetota bacterium]
MKRVKTVACLRFPVASYIGMNNEKSRCEIWTSFEQGIAFGETVIFKAGRWQLVADLFADCSLLVA